MPPRPSRVPRGGGWAAAGPRGFGASCGSSRASLWATPLGAASLGWTRRPRACSASRGASWLDGVFYTATRVPWPSRRFSAPPSSAFSSASSEEQSSGCRRCFGATRSGGSLGCWLRPLVWFNDNSGSGGAAASITRRLRLPSRFQPIGRAARCVRSSPTTRARARCRRAPVACWFGSACAASTLQHCVSRPTGVAAWLAIARTCAWCWP
mmetsp:Transcript_50182/g.162450  ORF Transcript_50182/g.162450 Transcript_50182/m.162450 type:complete len:210 (+) Transcript_50182:2658-3287(+)